LPGQRQKKLSMKFSMIKNRLLNNPAQA
jgi:hypothetical protein